MTKKPVLNDKAHQPLPPQLAECIAIAQARCADLRCAERAYSAIEKFMSLARSGELAGPKPDEKEEAALLALVRQESARRLGAMREALECLSAAKAEELARRRGEG